MFESNIDIYYKNCIYYLFFPAGFDLWLGPGNPMITVKTGSGTCTEGSRLSTVCPRSSDPFYIVGYYTKWVTTSWTHSSDWGKRKRDSGLMFILSKSHLAFALLSYEAWFAIKNIFIYISFLNCVFSCTFNLLVNLQVGLKHFWVLTEIIHYEVFDCFGRSVLWRYQG